MGQEDGYRSGMRPDHSGRECGIDHLAHQRQPDQVDWKRDFWTGVEEVEEDAAERRLERRRWTWPRR